MTSENTIETPRSSPGAPEGKRHSWKEIVARYQRPAPGRAAWQLCNTVIPYVGLWWLMYRSLAVSFWCALPLALLAGAFLVRLFIIFHDCAHNSFFKARWANEMLGNVAGVLCFTPFYRWRWEHSVHHASSGDLDRRGIGDIWTMTMKEYLAASRRERLAYRFKRNPVILFVLAPLFLFLIVERVPTGKEGLRERLSVYGTDVAMVLVIGGMSWLMGWKACLVLQLIVIMVAGSAGVWLFYVQHQFEDAYWEHGDEWEFEKAALQGSSYYKLPRILQWFSGNIGFHHIHHLSPRIPNYRLEECHRAEPLFNAVKPITFSSSLKSFNYRLWDEQSRRLVGYPRSPIQADRG